MARGREEWGPGRFISKPCVTEIDYLYILYIILCLVIFKREQFFCQGDLFIFFCIKKCNRFSIYVCMYIYRGFHEKGTHSYLCTQG